MATIRTLMRRPLRNYIIIRRRFTDLELVITNDHLLPFWHVAIQLLLISIFGILRLVLGWCGISLRVSWWFLVGQGVVCGVFVVVFMAPTMSFFADVFSVIVSEWEKFG
jgi:hypothetical protein